MIRYHDIKKSFDTCVHIHIMYIHRHASARTCKHRLQYHSLNKGKRKKKKKCSTTFKLAVKVSRLLKVSLSCFYSSYFFELWKNLDHVCLLMKMMIQWEQVRFNISRQKRKKKKERNCLGFHPALHFINEAVETLDWWIDKCSFTSLRQPAIPGTVRLPTFNIYPPSPYGKRWGCYKQRSPALPFAPPPLLFPPFFPSLIFLFSPSLLFYTKFFS